MATVRTPVAGQRLVLHQVDWPAYTAIGRALADRPALRLTYDRGVLEIMTTSSGHERIKQILRRLIEAWTEERGVVFACFGSMTFKRRPRLRGLEPEECFWIVNEPAVHGKDHIDLRVDPPPDLMLEIDISRSSLDRMGIYGILGVPEVWRFSRRRLHFQVRKPDGIYEDVPQSRALPPLTPGDLLPFLALRATTDENSIVRQFRAWVRQTHPGGQAPPTP